MIQIIKKHSVATVIGLAAFEKDMYDMTLGYSLARSMSYNTFRRMVLQYHLTGTPEEFKCILQHNHFISLESGVATLYRIVDEEGVEHGQEDSDSEEDKIKGRKPKKQKVENFK
jgi:hypothetical protein